MTLPICLPVALAALLVSVTADAATSTWHFEARLDGKSVGTHHFSVEGGDGGRVVTSSARFDVRILGIPAYRYVHRAREHWSGDCVSGFESRTDDNGAVVEVSARAIEGVLDVHRNGARERFPGCVMTFAYWNPAMRTRSQLLNPQTGRFDSVQIALAGSGTVEVRGRDVAARRWRIRATGRTIDVWYAQEGDEWIGLDASLEGGRNLSYRLP